MSKLLYSHLIPRVNTSCDSDLNPFFLRNRRSLKFSKFTYARLLVRERHLKIEGLIERKSQTRWLSKYEANITCAISPKCDPRQKKKMTKRHVFQFPCYCCWWTLQSIIYNSFCKCVLQHEPAAFQWLTLYETAWRHMMSSERVGSLLMIWHSLQSLS